MIRKKPKVEDFTIVGCVEKTFQVMAGDSFHLRTHIDGKEETVISSDVTEAGIISDAFVAKAKVDGHEAIMGGFAFKKGRK